MRLCPATVTGTAATPKRATSTHSTHNSRICTKEKKHKKFLVSYSALRNPRPPGSLPRPTSEPTSPAARCYIRALCAGGCGEGKGGVVGLRTTSLLATCTSAALTLAARARLSCGCPCLSARRTRMDSTLRGVGRVWPREYKQTASAHYVRPRADTAPVFCLSTLIV